MKSEKHTKSYLKEIIVGVSIIVIGYYFTDGCGCNKNVPNSNANTEVKTNFSEANVKVENGDYVAGDKIVQNVTKSESTDTISKKASYQKNGSNSYSKTIPQGNSRKDVKPAYHEDRSIKMENSPGAIANTGDSVTIIQQQIKSKYDIVPLSEVEKNSLMSNIKNLEKKYGNNAPKIIIDFENKSQQITKINLTIADALSQNGVNIYKQPSQYWDICLKPHIVFSEDLTDFVTDLTKAISSYIRSPFEKYPIKGKGIVRIRLCGTPVFENNGSVSFE